MADALRVLLLSWRDSRHPEGGGAEVFLERLASGLHERGHEVTIRCAAYDGARREEVVDGVRFIRRGGRFTVYPSAALSLLPRPRRYDVVVDVQNGVPFWAPLFTRAKVVNLTHHVHREQWPVIFGPVGARFGWWLESRLAPRVYRRCRYVTVSQASRRDLVALGVAAESIGVVYNGHDVAAVDHGLVPLPRAPQPTLVVLSRLVPHKRVDLAVLALGALRRAVPDLRLVVIGHGYWEPQLRSLAEQLGVSDAVHFAGYVDEPTKHRLLAEAWLHVMPSVKEGWGLAVVESAAHRTPTVAFRAAGGPAESVVHGETGLLVDDAEGMVEALRLLLTDGDLRRRLGEQARRRAEEYTWAGTVAAFEAELWAVLGRPQPQPQDESAPTAPADSVLGDPVLGDLMPGGPVLGDPVPSDLMPAGPVLGDLMLGDPVPARLGAVPPAPEPTAAGPAAADPSPVLG
jgi:glycosyltransferase involved in cell wall biosynthesis